MTFRVSFALLLLCGGCKQQQVPTIEYQGQRYRLTRSFDDYDQFKETVDNIHPEEIERVKNAVVSVPIAKEFNTKQDFVLAALKIKFPGFGFGGLDSPSNIHTATIEIPRKDSDRYITAIEKAGRWYVADDFVGPIGTGGSTVQIEQGQIVYKRHDGSEIRRTRIE